jgi:hypothetical protein
MKIKEWMHWVGNPPLVYREINAVLLACKEVILVAYSESSDPESSDPESSEPEFPDSELSEPEFSGL